MNKVKISITELLSFLGDEVICVYGDTEGVFIDNLADVEHVTESTLDWVNPSKSKRQIIVEQSKAKVVLVDKGVAPVKSKVLVVVQSPKRALAKVGNAFFVEHHALGIHPTAIISPEAKIGKRVYIGPYSVIGKAEIGDGCIIESNVRIFDGVTMGIDCSVKPGAVLGGEGFGFVEEKDGNHFRFPQIGGVIIGDYVEIGANTCIDRGALSDTIIEDYVKIDNLCHIAHNALIGKNTVVVACAEISGSCTVGESTWVGPNACIRDQRSVGSNSLIGIGAVVVKSIPDNEVWAGNPAKPMHNKE